MLSEERPETHGDRAQCGAHSKQRGRTARRSERSAATERAVRSAHCGSAVRIAVFFRAHCARFHRTAFTHCARFHRTAVDFHTALRSISPHCVRFPPQCASAVRSIQTAQVPRSAPRPVTEPRPVAWKPLPRFPRPVAPSAGASHTHTASYNYSHSHHTRASQISARLSTRPKPAARSRATLPATCEAASRA